MGKINKWQNIYSTLQTKKHNDKSKMKNRAKPE